MSEPCDVIRVILKYVMPFFTNVSSIPLLEAVNRGSVKHFQ